MPSAVQKTVQLFYDDVSLFSILIHRLRASRYIALTVLLETNFGWVFEEAVHETASSKSGPITDIRLIGGGLLMTDYSSTRTKCLLALTNMRANTKTFSRLVASCSGNISFYSFSLIVIQMFVDLFLHFYRWSRTNAIISELYHSRVTSDPARPVSEESLLNSQWPRRVSL